MHGQAALGPGPHRLVEHLAPVAAAGLGPVHGGVGVLDQRLGPDPAARGQGDADAHGDEHLGVAEGERRGGHLGDPLGDGQGVGLVGDALAEDGELVAAEAGHGVAGPDDLLEALAQGDQQPVAGVVAERVVDELEPVQVQEEHGHRGAAALGAGQGEGDPVQEEDPVGQAGEGVVGGLVGQLGLGVAALDGDVGQVGGQLQQALLGRAGPAGLVEVDGEDARTGPPSAAMIGVDQAARMPLASATWRDSRHSGSRATSAEITGSRRKAAVPLAPASGPRPGRRPRAGRRRSGWARRRRSASRRLSSSNRMAQRAPEASASITLARASRVSIRGASRAIRSSTWAWPASWPSARVRSVTSRQLNTTPPTAGSSSRLLARASMLRQDPSAARKRNPNPAPWASPARCSPKRARTSPTSSGWISSNTFCPTRASSR